MRDSYPIHVLAEILLGVLRARPQAWTQGVLARDAQGQELLDVHDPAATCRCLVGWIYVKGPSRSIVTVNDLAGRLVRALSTEHTCLARWNDSRRDAHEVIEALERVAAGYSATPLPALEEQEALSL